MQSMSDQNASVSVSAVAAVTLTQGTQTEILPGGIRDSWTVIGSSMLVGTAALMILGIQPVLLGALTEEGRISETMLGQLATVEVLALAIGSAVGAYLLQKGRIAAKVALGSLLLAAMNAAIYASHSVLMLFLTRGAAGLLEGYILGAAIVVITHSTSPDRLNGLFLALQTIPQAMLAYALPVSILPRVGADGGFAILAGMALVAAVAAFALTERHPPAAVKHATAGTVWTPAVLGILLGVVLQNAAIGGAWNYAERIAVELHIAPDLVGAALAVSLMLQVVGAFAVAWFAWRLPFRLVTILGPLCQGTVIMLIATANSSLVYFGATAAFGLFWLALNPFQVRLLIDMEPSRQAVMTGTAVTLFGLSVGPFLSSFGVGPGDVRGAFLIAAGLMLLSSITFAVSMAAHRRSMRLSTTMQ
jgi:MFS family permease